MKQTRKVVSLVVCFVMLLSMMTAMTAGAAVKDVPFYTNDFENGEADLTKDGVTSTQFYEGNYIHTEEGYLTVADDAERGSKVLSLTNMQAPYEFQEDEEDKGQSNPRFMTLGNFTWKKGSSYTISFWAKSSNPITITWNLYCSASVGAGRKNYGPTWTVTTSSAWTQYTIDFTIEELYGAVGSTTVDEDGVHNAKLIERMTGYGLGDYLLIDDIVISEKVEYDAKTATVTVSGNGTVKNGDAAVASGSSVTVATGETLTLTAVPAEGQVVKSVTVDGAEVVLNDDNQFTVTMDADKAIVANFAPANALFYNAFDTTADIDNSIVTIQSPGGLIKTVRTGEGKDGGDAGAIRWDDRFPNWGQTTESAGTRTINMPLATTADSFVWEAGKTYNVSYWAKANYAGATALGVLNTNLKVNPDAENFSTYNLADTAIGTDWTKLSWTFTIDSFEDGSASKEAIIAWRHTPSATALVMNSWERADKGGYVYIQDFTITEVVPAVEHNATVTISGNGTVANGDVAVASGDVIAVEEGDTLTLDVTPGQGYEATVTVDGTAVEVVNGKVAVVVNADTAIVVSFAPVGALFYNAFDTAEDIANTIVTIQQPGGMIKKSYADKGMNGGSAGAIRWDDRFPNYGLDTTSHLTRTINMPLATTADNFVWEAGKTYTVSYWAKATYEGATAMAVFNTSAYINGNENANTYNLEDTAVGTDWTKVSWSFTIDAFEDGSASKEADLCWRHTPSASWELGTNAYDYLRDGNSYFMYIQDFTIVEGAVVPEKAKATVSISGNGTVMNGDAAVNNGDEIEVEVGETLTLNVAPATGYEVAVTQDGSPVTPNSDGDVTFTVTEDTEIVVTFTEIAAVAAGIAENATINLSAVIDGVPTILVYSQLNNFTTNETVNYGIKLWDAADAEHKLSLKVRDENGNLAVAVPNLKFAVKAFGDAITANGAYVAQPFAGEAEGTEVEISFAE